MTKRMMLMLAALFLAPLPFAASISMAQSVKTATKDLPPPGPLGDVAQGPDDAKVTIVEYASMTCSHCAEFHKTTYPILKQRYIDTGQVRYILREFPLDPLATAGFMLARCNGNAQYYPVIDLLFLRQRDWAFKERPVDALQGIVKQAGFSQEKFESCLRDDTLLNAVNDVKNRAEQTLAIDSTPTFFINGQIQRGAISIETIEQVIKPILAQ